MVKAVQLVFLLILLVGSSFASQTLGTFEKGNNVTLVQSCYDSSYSNITKITYPNSSLALDGDVSMIKNGDTYSYVFSDTDQLGRYLVYGHCDEGGYTEVWVYDFEITYTGQKVSLSNAMIIFALLGLSGIFLTICFFFNGSYWMLRFFFQFLAILSGLIAVNSARIIASESNALGTMGDMGLLTIIVVLALYFLWMFVYAFKEIISVFKKKGDLRWSYD